MQPIYLKKGSVAEFLYEVYHSFPPSSPSDTPAACKKIIFSLDTHSIKIYNDL